MQNVKDGAIEQLKIERLSGDERTIIESQLSLQRHQRMGSIYVCESRTEFPTKESGYSRRVNDKCLLKFMGTPTSDFRLEEEHNVQIVQVGKDLHIDNMDAPRFLPMYMERTHYDMPSMTFVDVGRQGLRDPLTIRFASADNRSLQYRDRMDCEDGNEDREYVTPRVVFWPPKDLSRLIDLKDGHIQTTVDGLNVVLMPQKSKSSKKWRIILVSFDPSCEYDLPRYEGSSSSLSGRLVDGSHGGEPTEQGSDVLWGVRLRPKLKEVQ